MDYLKKGSGFVSGCAKRVVAWFMTGMLLMVGIIGNVENACANEKEKDKQQDAIWVCPAEEKELEYPVEPTKTTGNKVSVRAISKNGYQGSYGYSQLTLNEQRWAYVQMEKAADSFQNSDADAEKVVDEETGEVTYEAVTVMMDGQITNGNIGKTVVCFLYDHPEYVWSLGYSYYLYRADGTVSDDERLVHSVVLNCHERYQNGKERAQLRDKMQKEIEKYLDLIAGVRSDYEKELILHDALANQITYAYTSDRKPEPERWAHTIEGVFSDQYYKAVCEGYAKAFQLLLNAAGIENVYVLGTSNGQGHAWNQVKIGSSWYNVDLTWNDTGDRKSYRYFNLDDESFLTNHKVFSSEGDKKVGSWCYSVNICNDTEYSYKNQGEYKEGDTFIVGTQVQEGMKIRYFNQGVEVASGCAVASGTALEVQILPDNTEDMLEILVAWDNQQKTWKEKVGEDGISFPVVVTKDMFFGGWVYVPATKISLNQSSITFTGYGKKKTLVAALQPETASKKEITWKSSNPKVAKVSSGVVTSVSKGNAVISAYAEGKKLVASCKVNVKAPYIKITSSKTSVKVGKTITMKGVVYGTSKQSIRWSVSNKRASIGAKTGKLKGKKPGTVWVKATQGNITVKKKITVKK